MRWSARIAVAVTLSAVAVAALTLAGWPRAHLRFVVPLTSTHGSYADARAGPYLDFQGLYRSKWQEHCLGLGPWFPDTYLVTDQLEPRVLFVNVRDGRTSGPFPGPPALNSSTRDADGLGNLLWTERTQTVGQPDTYALKRLRPDDGASEVIFRGHASAAVRFAGRRKRLVYADHNFVEVYDLETFPARLVRKFPALYTRLNPDRVSAFSWRWTTDISPADDALFNVWTVADPADPARFDGVVEVVDLISGETRQSFRLSEAGVSLGPDPRAGLRAEAVSSDGRLLLLNTAQPWSSLRDPGAPPVNLNRDVGGTIALDVERRAVVPCDLNQFPDEYRGNVSDRCDPAGGPRRVVMPDSPPPDGDGRPPARVVGRDNAPAGEPIPLESDALRHQDLPRDPQHSG